MQHRTGMHAATPVCREQLHSDRPAYTVQQHQAGTGHDACAARVSRSSEEQLPEQPVWCTPSHEAASSKRVHVEASADAARFYVHRQETLEGCVCHTMTWRHVHFRVHHACQSCTHIASGEAHLKAFSSGCARRALRPQRPHISLRYWQVVRAVAVVSRVTTRTKKDSIGGADEHKAGDDDQHDQLGVGSAA